MSSYALLLSEKHNSSSHLSIKAQYIWVTQHISIQGCRIVLECRYNTIHSPLLAPTQIVPSLSTQKAHFLFQCGVWPTRLCYSHYLYNTCSQYAAPSTSSELLRGAHSRRRFATLLRSCESAYIQKGILIPIACCWNASVYIQEGAYGSRSAYPSLCSKLGLQRC